MNESATIDKEALAQAVEEPAENIRREDLGDGVVHLIFDRPGETANVFNIATLDELNAHLQAIAGDGAVKGLVMTSAKPSIFIAGADIKELFVGNPTDDEVRHAVAKGQAVFSSLAALKFPTVAAMHGAALGGGCEMALACDYRVATNAKATRIGLPETMLGILPAWGGSTRLPRTVGLSTALNSILGGKSYVGVKAKRIGLVDAVVPQEELIPTALKLLQKGKARPRSFGIKHSGMARAIVAKFARKASMKKTRGHYPAIPKALDVIVAGLGTTIEKSLLLEQDAIVELAKTPVCKNLVRVFLLQERSKGFRVELPEGAEADPRPVNNVAVIGAGVMGAGIAQWCSARGQDVILKDINEEQIAAGLGTISKIFQQAAKRKVFTKVEAREGMDRIYPTATDVPLRQVDLVVEAAVERMDIKKQLFHDLAESARPDTVLATNTSALSITEIAEGLPYPERVVGIHYFNPVHKMQLVEVVVGAQTDPMVTDRVVRFVQKSGKLPVVVKDSPGFVVNRILMPYLGEAGYLAGHGADYFEIDKAMLDFGMPMGPIRLTDEVGIDVCAHVARNQAEHFPGRTAVPEVLDRMLEQKFLGKKVGKGFYVYGAKGKREANPVVTGWVTDRSCASLSRAELQQRMVLLMVNEAARCIEEGLVAGPEDVDFAMIFGTGFAPFQGGPLRYADTFGLSKLVEASKTLQAREGDRFAPCALLETMALEGRTFYS